MSENQFENYLALLTSLLRLSRSQSEAIARELRDHLEERLNDLLNDGVEHDEAVRIALKEFGDAAGLATSFASVFQVQRKRWIMRLTTSSVIGVLAITFVALCFWPTGPNDVVRDAVAQDATKEPAADIAEAATTQDEPTIEENNKATERKLGSRFDAEFLETPLGDVLEFIGDSQKIQFHFDQAAMEEMGVDRNVSTTLSLKRVRVDMVLDLVLEPLDLVYVVRDGIVIVTTNVKIESRLEVRVYNCRDLLELADTSANKRRPTATAPKESAPGGGFGGGAEGGFSPGEGYDSDGGAMSGGPSANVKMLPATPADDLIGLIQTTVASDTWDVVGGYGTIEEFGGLLVINHDPHTHRMIARVLDMMRTTTDKDPGTVVTQND